MAEGEETAKDDERKGSKLGGTQYVLEQLQKLGKTQKQTTPRIQQFDLFYEYKELEQEHISREQSKKPLQVLPQELKSRLREGKKSESIEQPDAKILNLPLLVGLGRQRNLHRANEASLSSDANNREQSKEKPRRLVLPALRKPERVERLLSKVSAKGKKFVPRYNFKSLSKLVIQDPKPYNPFADRNNPARMYEKAEYISKLPINPKVDISNIEDRINKLIALKHPK